METKFAFPQIASKIDLVRELTRSLPINSFGLLDGFYRVDLLPNPSRGKFEQTSNGEVIQGSVSPTPETLHDPVESLENSSLPVNSAFDSQTEGNGESLPLSTRRIGLAAQIDLSVLKSAYVPLSYQEGFPSLIDGMPFWSQLDFEPLPAFLKFQSYLEQGIEGTRQIFLLKSDDITEDNYNLQEISVLYYWVERARAYDLFKVASFKYQQEMRAIDMLDNHYLLAKKLLAKAEIYFEDDEFTELLTPSTAIDLLKTVVQLQRLSVGLPPGAAPQSSKDTPPAAGNIEVILRGLVPPRVASDTLVQQDDGSFALNKALQDPDTAAAAQELIIRIQQSNAA